ncbi:MAG: hypothetical protein WKF43_03340 [Acidimicrobiales bacterium]
MTVAVSVDRERFVEGDELVLAVRLDADRTVDRIEVAAELPIGLTHSGPTRWRCG